MQFETLIYEKGSDGIATLTLNRPQVLNAQNWKMQEERPVVLADARDDDSVRVLILTGAGRAFCSGDDVKQMWLNPERTEHWFDFRLNDLKGKPPRPSYLDGFYKPIIAAVNGPAVGAGLEMALECDIRIASENAKFGWFFVRRNLQGTQSPVGMMRLLHMVELGRAMEFMLSGELVEGEEAVKIGLADKLVPQDKLMDEARALARKLMQGAPLAQLAIKRLVHTAFFDPQKLVDLSNTLGTTLRQTQDHMEAAKAFVEKRPAQFKMR